jgi:hypothetical protein
MKRIVILLSVLLLVPAYVSAEIKSIDITIFGMD